MRPKRRSHVTERDLDGETLILDRLREEVHQLNVSASYVWRCCDGHLTVNEIAIAMARDFSIDLEEAEKDATRIISQLIALGLLQSE